MKFRTVSFVVHSFISLSITIITIMQVFFKLFVQLIELVEADKSEWG